MGEPLSVASAIIGIIAAAGKVAEILGPLISSVKDSKNIARGIRDQVEESRIIVQALQRLFDDLEQSPRRRRDLIQIDQLRATLCNGIVIFSDLEPLVVQLSTSNESLRSRVQWARRRDQLETFNTRLEHFKTSINTMLNILQCESDLDAAANRQELYNLVEHLLQSNRDLWHRLSLLQSGRQEDGNSIYSQTGQKTSLESIQSQIRAFEFERDLKESRVYRAVRRSTTDASFRSSIALSHAWSTLSDISLSDISVISVVALPISSSDLSNGHYYRQGQRQLGESGSQQEGKELVIGPPTLVWSTYQEDSSLIPIVPSLATMESGQHGAGSSNDQKTEEDFWAPQRNRDGTEYFFNTHSGFFCLPNPQTTPRTTEFSFIPQVNKDGKLFYYRQAMNFRTEKLPLGMAPSQKKFLESNAQSVLDLFPTFNNAVATQAQASPTEQASANSSPTSLSPKTAKQSPQSSEWSRHSSHNPNIPTDDIDLDGSASSTPHARSTDESFRALSLSNGPGASPQGMDTVLESIVDLRCEREQDGSEPVTPRQPSSGPTGFFINPTKSLPRGSKSGKRARFVKEYKLVIIRSGIIGGYDVFTQFIYNRDDSIIGDPCLKQCFVDDQPALLNILDTAGQEEYSGMIENHTRAAAGFMIVYSITSRASFEDTMCIQQKILRVKDSDYFPMILIGKDCDLESEREVSVAEGQRLAHNIGCPFTEVSTKGIIQVDNAFYELVREMRRWIAESARGVTVKQQPVKRRQAHDWLKRSRRIPSMDTIDEGS